MTDKPTIPRRDVLVGLAEICDHLGMGQKMVRRLAESDQAFPVARGARWVSSRAALDRWSYDYANRRGK